MAEPTLAHELAWVYGLAPRGIRYELERIRAALDLLGGPDDAFPVIHVAGTNGKGSVSAMVERGLRAAGLRTGLFTSPHLHRFAERIRIGGRPLGDRRLAAGLARLRRVLAAPSAPPLTFFETTFLLALQAFREAGDLDVVVLETGLGGRLDATNAARRVEVSVITTLALDHLDLLGPTLLDVAREKAGIVRPGVPLVCGVRQPEARAVVEETACRLGAPLLLLGRELEVLPAAPGRFAARCGRRELGPFRPALRGAHQAANAAVACATVLAFGERRSVAVSDEALRVAVERVRWAGRLEVIAARGRRPRVLLDAAHNVEGAQALASHARALGIDSRRVALVFGAQATKDAGGMLEVLAPVAGLTLFVAAPVRGAVPPAVLAARFGGVACDDVVDALRRAGRAVGPHGLVLVAGSIFVMAAARAHLLAVRSDPPVAL